MFTAIKIESTIRPKKFESLNNGIWYYNYDIVEKTVITRDISNEEDKEELRYDFIQVRINGNPTVPKCYEAILKSYKDNNISLYEALNIGEAPIELIDEIYYNIKVDFGLEIEITPLDKAKKSIINKIDNYDQSPNVNSFFVNGTQVWLNKDTRVGLMNSLTIEKNSGKETSTIWFGTMYVNTSCDTAIQMLKSLELYAIACYNKTAEHKVSVNNLDNIEDVINYDFTQGYPSKLIFNI